MMRFSVALWMAFISWVTVCSSPPAVASPTATQTLDDAIEPLAPKVARTEEDEDKLTAAALFSAGRTLEQRQKLPAALRRYQRALRYAPDAKPILREMLPLAFSLERRDVVLRFLTAHLDETGISDPLLLRAAAEYLAEEGNWSAALKLYRQVELLLAGDKPSPAQVLVQLELGRLNFLRGNYAESAAAYQQVLDALSDPKKFGLDPKTQRALAGDDGELFELMGSVFLEAKRPEQALQAFTMLDQRDPDGARRSFNAARVKLVTGNPQAALDELQKFFDAKQPPETTTPYEVLAEALKELNQSDQLVSRLEVLRKSQPESASLAFYLGEEYRQASRWQDAAALFEAAIAARPTADAYQSLSQVYCHTGDAAAMLKLLVSVAEKTGSLSALGGESIALIKNEKLLAKVLAVAIEQHREAQANDAAALRVAALLASEAKRWDDAERLMNLAIQADPSATAGLLIAWGIDLFVAEKYDRAAAVFQRGIDEIAVKDEIAACSFYLAGALEMEGQSDEALAAAQRAAKQKPDDPMFASRPAWILYHAKRYDDAELAYQTFLEKFNDDFSTPGAREMVQQANLVLSNLSVLRGDQSQGVEYLEQVLDEFPNDIGANNDLGYLWVDENRHLKRAHRMIQVAVANEPENAAYRDSLGWALFRLGRLAEALEELQKAVELEKANGKGPDPTVLDHLGDVYQKLGRIADARVSWKQSIEGYQREKETDKIKPVEQKLRASEKPPPSGDGR
ncbi:MAG: tetratricopeptide repeat protein [Pirellulales bacterium]|nr:tetratricopeptide repeat protein [Pirellulales bacterium]